MGHADLGGSEAQVAASGMGGYLAGRLRTRWLGVHSDEVYFRDTAHGFLAWALATLVTAAMLTSVVGSILGAGGNAVGTVAAGAANTAATAVPAAAAAGGASRSNVSGYFVDTLFRKQTGSQSPSSSAIASVVLPWCFHPHHHPGRTVHELMAC